VELSICDICDDVMNRVKNLKPYGQFSCQVSGHTNFYGNSTDMFLILSIICVKRHGNHGTQPEVDEMDENHQRKGFKEHISKYDLFKYA
jgi:hypothetical protein